MSTPAGAPVPPAPQSLTLPATLVAAATGALIAMQGRLNGDLSTAGAGTLVASLASYLGTLATVVLVIAVRGGAPTTARLLHREGRWWWYAIGLLGVPIVLAFTGGVPLVGVAIASVAAVAGQTVSGLTLDARGIGLPAPLGLSRRRVLAGLLALAGLGLAVLAGGTGRAAPLTAALVGLALFAGGLAIAGQQAGAGAVTAVARDPLIAGLTTAIGGSTLMAVVVGGTAWSGALADVQLPTAWYLYLGGPLGAGITVGAAWAVRHLGTFALTLAVVGGQMTAALALDLAGGVSVPWTTVTAAALIVGATLTAVGGRSPLAFRRSVRRPAGTRRPG